MNINRLIAKKIKKLFPKLSEEDKLLIEKTLIATAKEKGRYDDKAKAQIRQLIGKL